MSVDYDYREAVSRNIGWVTEAEQAILRTKRIAIAGLGGVGGSHLLTLTRLGIGHFRIADPDTFEVANFNRQAGAFLSTVGRSKAAVLEEMAREINPTLSTDTFAEGITPANVGRFLEDVDLYVDGLDFFAVEARRMVFAACAERSIPAVTAAPLGMGAAVLNFLPGDMSFEEYFRLEGHEPHEQLIRFLIGLSPAMLQRGYLVDSSAVDLLAGRGPSTPMACEVCAGAAAAEALKILLNRGPVRTAPRGTHYDPYRNRLARTWRPGGNRNPVQRLAITVARRQLARMRAAAPPPEPDPAQPQTVVEQILDLARWAPSGDNTQPWRFEIRDRNTVIVRGRAQGAGNPYEYNGGQPTWLSYGCLLEALRLSASVHRMQAQWTIEKESPAPVFAVVFEPAENVEPDPLAAHLRTRSVDRRRYRLSRLSADQGRRLETAVGPHMSIRWFESIAERWRWAKAASLSTKARLLAAETFAIHQQVIDFDRTRSPTGIPAAAVGLDPVGQRLMRWSFASFRRLNVLNEYFGGTWIPRLELDLLPGLCSAAYFTVALPASAGGVPEKAEVLRAGQAVMRLWLTADRLGLRLQPLLAPLAFGFHGRANPAFTESQGSRHAAARLARALQALLPESPESVVFLGRIGRPIAAPRTSRSVRLPLAQLLKP